MASPTPVLRFGDTTRSGDPFFGAIVNGTPIARTKTASSDWRDTLRWSNRQWCGALRFGGALALCVPGLVGCLSTTTTERDFGPPDIRVEFVPLPDAPRFEAVATQQDGKLQLGLTRSEMCRRLEYTTVRRQRVESRKIGAGAIVPAAIFGGVGFMLLGEDGSSGPLFIGVGGAILAIAAAATGSKTTELPPSQTLAEPTVARCRQRAAAGAEVLVVSAGVAHEGTSDSAGNLELDGLPPGPLRVLVEGQPATVREGRERPATPPLPTAEPPEASEVDEPLPEDLEEPSPSAPPEGAQPGPQPPSSPAPSQPPAKPVKPPPPKPAKPPPTKPAKPPPPGDPRTPVPLPPPPPPPPGAKVPASR